MVAECVAAASVATLQPVGRERTGIAAAAASEPLAIGAADGSRAAMDAAPNADALAGAALLAWYDRDGRALPWRVRSGRADPYRVWLSEVMLQQTTVAAVIPYFEAFTARWPTVEALAAADDGEVMAAWAGLGYYARARNLLACARAVAAAGGRFPQTAEALRRLPGIGAYTSAAVAAIAFGEPVPVVDGNVERVVARLLALKTPPKQASRIVRDTVAAMTPTDRPGDFAQAMMDLGATICTPRRPACALCPLRPGCRAAGEGDPTAYPVKAPKRPKGDWRGVAFVPWRPDGTVLVRRRAPKGLLGGMMEVYGSPWGEEPVAPLDYAPVQASWREAGAVTHVFTHANLTLRVFVASVGPQTAAPGDGCWMAPQDAGLPTLMRKVVERGLAGI
jgi:A/G-specific adenine glycosylase